MKQILLFIVCLFGLGTMAVHAQENSEPADLALYQKATKAIKDKKFVFKASLFDDGKRYYQVHHAQNYIVLEDDSFPEEVLQYIKVDIYRFVILKSGLYMI